MRQTAIHSPNEYKWKQQPEMTKSLHSHLYCEAFLFTWIHIVVIVLNVQRFHFIFLFVLLFTLMNIFKPNKINKINNQNEWKRSIKSLNNLADCWFNIWICIRMLRMARIQLPYLHEYKKHQISFSLIRSTRYPWINIDVTHEYSSRLL